jgi:hypothetical protein
MEVDFNSSSIVNTFNITDFVQTLGVSYDNSNNIFILCGLDSNNRVLVKLMSNDLTTELYRFILLNNMGDFQGTEVYENNLYIYTNDDQYNLFIYKISLNGEIKECIKLGYLQGEAEGICFYNIRGKYSYPLIGVGNGSDTQLRLYSVNQIQNSKAYSTLKAVANTGNNQGVVNTQDVKMLAFSIGTYPNAGIWSILPGTAGLYTSPVGVINNITQDNSSIKINLSKSTQNDHDLTILFLDSSTNFNSLTYDNIVPCVSYNRGQGLEIKLFNVATHSWVDPTSIAQSRQIRIIMIYSDNI